MSGTDATFPERGVFINLPVLNEAAHIERLLSQIDAAMDGRPYTVCVVDDGSRDGTRAILRRLAVEKPDHLHVIERQKTARGSQRGGALRTALAWGLTETAHTVFIEMDGDLSHRPEELGAGIELVARGEADVAIASKYVAGSRVINRPWGRKMVSWMCSVAVGTILSRRIRDYSNGYRFYSRAAAERLAAYPIRYTSPIYLTEVMALWLSSGAHIVEFPTIYVGRNEGVSKLRFTDLAKAVVAILEVAVRYHLKRFKLPALAEGRVDARVTRLTD